MTSIEDLLTRAALLKNPRIPEDIIPYLATYQDVPPTSPAGAAIADEVADEVAADQLQSLCAIAVTYTAASQFTDFITDELPAPGGAWVLGCLLHLAGAEDGSRYWWQYAAGAGERGASYCLSLHHRALGDVRAADFWLDQAEDGTQSGSGEASTATVLRIITQINADNERTLTEAARAVMSYTASAVNAGYRRYPDVEIPLPGPHFAETVQIILAVTGPTQRPPVPTPEALPARSDDAGHPPTSPEPDQILVRLRAPDEQWASAFHEAFAPAWKEVPLERPQPPGRGVLMQFVLDRRRSLTAARETWIRRSRASNSRPIGLEFG
ncbi:hypothetical protein E2C11_07360 [Streptomyces lavendulae]|nr:hypothetical protein [Streptomyces lavendulae]TXJ83286.1 hypothetical protein E2C11_07360 [Streptomyces lavendulae]